MQLVPLSEKLVSKVCFHKCNLCRYAADKDKVAEGITEVLCKWEKRKKKSPCPMDDEGKIEL
jgi:hypothetical protein